MYKKNIQKIKSKPFVYFFFHLLPLLPHMRGVKIFSLNKIDGQ
ncbi:hypothetical protein LEP1GSC036_1513 [Leptospira weilii str. 2006001853]|uniref:Uncharacterized protein n=1 Tax=Leptospira weilii str. 2006001853 TaxID=1001589 RepID=A0A828YW88_9LEPT|nr:hypothetical protein LEP1GSC036_1513 [Leptospira weilii str. 2006001853]EMN42472.1 hypothetical protein LEP1GSC086_1548 [Leptospira weilii str. LNT 1234]